MQVILSGIAGHMGQALVSMCREQGIEIAFGVDIVPVPGVTVYPSFDEAPKADAVIIDFSKPALLPSLLRYAVEKQVPAVIATTGYDEAQLQLIDEAAKSVAIFRSFNMSVGIALLQKLVRQAAEVLGDSFDVEIVEAHHNRKVDAPSGTALMLYEAVSQAYDEKPALVGGRYGRDCKRKKGEIGMHALRGGTVTGEHEVCFLGPMERITISHSAENRAVFASGALRAAIWLRDQAAGLYSMHEMVG